MAILDFSKTFDKATHNRLIHNLDFYGICGNLLGWLISFLSNHTQQVVVGGTYSSYSAMTSEAPQGSVLGPVLFLLYINNITINIHGQLHLFADDSLVYRFINSIADHQILQSDLDTLTTWTRWNLTFLDLSVKSFKCLLIIATKSFFSYKMCNCIPLEQHIQLLKCVSTSQLDYPGNLNKH